MKKRIGISLVLILFLSVQFVSAGLLCDYFGIYCDKNLKGELGSSNPIAVEGSCKDGIDNDNDGKIDYPNDRGCVSTDDNNEFGEPIGYLDGVKDCNAVYGWSCDPDDFNAVVDVHLYKDGPVGAGGSLLSIEKTNFQREPAVGNLCGGNATHGFSFALPNDIKDGKNHSVYAYAINLGTPANNQELEKYPVYFSCKTDCKKVCKNVGTKSEGWYDSCTEKLIEYAQCENLPQSISCDDSDGGKDLYKRGEIRQIYGNTREDNCINDKSLEEWQCSINGSGFPGLFDCPNGCKHGACVTNVTNNVCTDSDGGLKYFQKGKLITADNTYEDVCTDSNFVKEYFCDSLPSYYENYKCTNGCKDGACIEKLSEIKEQVKCIFKNSITEQKCYTAENNLISCKGVESCVINVSAEKGKKLEWKSSCGGYVSTLIDGVDEYAEFNCSVANEIKCTDSDGGLNYSVKGKTCVGDNCKEDICDNQNLMEYYCSDNDRRSQGYDCLPEQICKDGACVKSSGESTLCNGCLSDKKCYPIGYRKDGNFCSDKGSFIKQLIPDKSCQNNFECSSNLCISGKCINPSLIERMFNWFRKIFGK